MEIKTTLCVSIMLALMVGCANKKYHHQTVNDTSSETLEETRLKRFGKVFGDVVLFDGGKLKSSKLASDDSTVKATPSNALWQAAIFVVASLPLESVDPKTNFITTGWHSFKGDKGREIKFNILLLDEKITKASLKIVQFERRPEDKYRITSTESSAQIDALKNRIITQAKEKIGK